jgi:murein DD-endopeptidase MepM/ murein hydrolase activator NlpD
LTINRTRLCLVMNKKRSYRIFLILFIAVILRYPFSASAAQTLELTSLDDAAVTQIKSDVKKALFAVKGGKDTDQIPPLKFYSYKLKKGDTFWKVVSRTTLNIDTIMTVNNLSSPNNVNEGDVLYFPNMRGVIAETKGQSVLSLEQTFRVKGEYILSVNKVSALNKPYLFIPCGEVTSLERSLFLGTGFAAPLETLRRTSNFGMRNDPLTGEKSFHSGVDLGCKVNTPVFAARTGKVIFTGYKGEYGQLVIVEHTHGYYSYYGHLSRIKVKRGDKVTAKTCLAMSGNTGRTTGPHLHFEIRKNERPVNPVIVLR